jgi:hypothetical protein
MFFTIFLFMRSDESISMVYFFDSESGGYQLQRGHKIWRLRYTHYLPSEQSPFMAMDSLCICFRYTLRDDSISLNESNVFLDYSDILGNNLCHRYAKVTMKLLTITKTTFSSAISFGSNRHSVAKFISNRVNIHDLIISSQPGERRKQVKKQHVVSPIEPTYFCSPFSTCSHPWTNFSLILTSYFASFS